MWVSWDTPDVRLVLESLRDLVVGTTVSKAEWESVRFEILACFTAIAEPPKTVPQEVLAATREMVMLERGASGGPAGTVTLTHAQLMELLDAAVAKAAAAAGGASGAPAGGASASGAEGQFRKALAASQDKRDGRSVEHHKQVRASVLAEGTALEAHDFPELTWSRPMLEDEGCDIDELSAGEEASLEDRCVLVHLLRERVTAMQEFVRGKEPGATFEDVMDGRLVCEEETSFALASGSNQAATCRPGGPDRRGGRGGGAHTWARGGRALGPGFESVQYPGQSLDTQSSKPVLGEDGRSLQRESANKRTRCSTLPEWERGFCFVLRKVKSERQHRLMVYFKDWFQYRAMEYGVVNLIKFYEFLILQMEEDPSVTFERRCYAELFEDYTREQQLRQVKAPRPWTEDRNQRGGKDKSGKGAKARNNPPNPPRDAGGKGGKGGKGKGRGGAELPHYRRACTLHNRTRRVYL
ncbi:hypothetical protein CYMTET_51934 [Cymbomonas tetramitiformis]|uniref:Uncharacterized protein n=1 Tax=Cymbomonas tetramitiformis TaxID=36881 RepID=A0AAE0BLP0_9CHLO|nr:hypothetical protein CYMTET_51934 [Cymbomonas tetramitiformis]